MKTENYTQGDIRIGYNLGFEDNGDNNGYKSAFNCINDIYSYLEGVKFKKVAIEDNSNNTMVAIDESGNLWAWGYNYSNSLPVQNGQSTSYNSSIIEPTLVSVPDNAKIVDVAVSSMGGAAIAEDGSLYVWGSVFGNNGNYTRNLVLAYDENYTKLNGKHFVKTEIGYNNTAVIVVDTEGHVYGIMGIKAIYDISENVNTDYGKVIAKDIYCGPTTIVIKDILDDIYVVGNYSAVGGEGGTSVGSSAYKMSNTNLNPLYGKTIKHQIAPNVVSVAENEKETVYVLSSDGKSVRYSKELDCVKAYINEDYYTVIFDNENHLYRKSGDSLNLEYSDVVMDKIIYKDSSKLIIQDVNGNTYIISSSGIKKLTSIRIENILYNNNGIIIASASDGNIYKIDDAKYTLLNFDEGIEIESIWMVTTGNSEKIIFFQDKNNNLWVTMEKSSGSISSGVKDMSGISGVTAELLKNVQKVTGYTGSKIEKMYIDYYSKVVSCIDSNKNLWMWASDGYFGFVGKTPKIMYENIVEYKTKYQPNTGLGHSYLALDEEGNLYSIGTTYQNGQNKTIYGAIGGTDSNINLTTAGVGKVKEFYVENDGAIVVNEENKIYACFYGLAPRQLDISFNEIEEFYAFYSDSTSSTIYAKLKDGRGISITMKIYYQSVDISRFSLSNTPDVTINDQDYSAPRVIVIKDNITLLEISNEISASTVNPKTELGLVVKEDGKLYYRSSTLDTFKCISDIFAESDCFAKHFKVVKDTKYKD